MTEAWRNIKGFEGYQVSNMGRVKNIDRGSYLSLRTTQKGYLSIKLSKNGVRTNFLVHRLVAEAFLPNPENKPYIDHINGIRDDNRIENLRWCTTKENNNNPIYKERKSNSQKYGDNVNSKKVIQYNREGQFLNLYDSISRAKENIGSNTRHISDCCRNKPGYSIVAGYKWQYLEDYLSDWLDNFQDVCMKEEKAAC